MSGTESVVQKSHATSTTKNTPLHWQDYVMPVFFSAQILLYGGILVAVRWQEQEYHYALGFLLLSVVGAFVVSKLYLRSARSDRADKIARHEAYRREPLVRHLAQRHSYNSYWSYYNPEDILGLHAKEHASGVVAVPHAHNGPLKAAVDYTPLEAN